MAHLHIKEGDYTSTIYGFIKDQKFNDAIQVLNHHLQGETKTRAALSLLAYCYYQVQDFVNASDCYEQLASLHPEVEEYKLYYAQSLHKACLFQEAMKVACQIDNPSYQGRVMKLQAAIKYGEEDLSGAKSLVEQCPSDDPDTEINLGCLLFKEKRYEEACEKFMGAMQVVGYKADLSYNIALCHYMLKQYAPALKHIADIIEKGIREHPELSVGMTTEGIDVRSVGNSQTLHETALVEAFNLKAAMEYQLKNYDAAVEALTDMPPRSEEELDAVTLHNQALMNMENSPTQGFTKLQFLLQQNPFPPETFGNLLLLYVKYEYYDLAADVLAENAHLTYKYLTPYLYDFLEAVITRQTSPEEAYRKLDEMATGQTETLRKLTKQVQESRQNHDEESVKKAVNEYDEALE
ncbi:unnamed protein product, partial [Candidula unifasciata]